MPPPILQDPAVPPLGGVFALEQPGTGGMKAFWDIRADLAWEDATSALAALVRHLTPGVVWFPGYICSTILAAVPAARRRFYRLNAALDPDSDGLANVSAGDIVLAVNMFGRAPGPGWRRFVLDRPDITFVEDCAQALDTGQSPWGDWRLFSPRKLFGVPDGGLLVPVSARARQSGLLGPELRSDPRIAARHRAPMQLRRDEPFNNTLWHLRHQAAERSRVVSARTMDQEAMALLTSLDPAPMRATRIANFSCLADRLAAFALLPDRVPTYAPMGFPVMLRPERRDEVLAALHVARIFAAVHWRDIPAPAHFLTDHARAASLITLPCDHRYGLPEMATIAASFLAACR